MKSGPPGGCGCLRAVEFLREEACSKGFRACKAYRWPERALLIWIRAAVRPLDFCMASGGGSYGVVLLDPHGRQRRGVRHDGYRC